MAFSERLPPFGPVLPYLFSNPANRLDFDPAYPKEPKTFRDYIRKWRMEKGICQADLAKRIGVNEMTIVNWEKGKTKPAQKYLQRLSGFLDGVAAWVKG